MPTPPGAEPSAPVPTIAFDLRGLVAAPTGIGVYTLSLARALAARGTLRLIGMAHREPAAAGELRGAGVAVEWQPAPRGVLWQQLVLPRRLSRGDVDLFWSPLGTLPLRLPVPAVVTVHDLTPVLYPETHTLKLRLSFLPFLQGTLDRAKEVVASSAATASDLRAQFPQCAPRLRVVYPGVDKDFRPATDEEMARTRAGLGCPQGYILYAGTLEPRKNVALLLDAWEALRRDDPSFPPLVLAGPPGWRSRALSRRIAALGARGLVALGRVPRPRLVALVAAARVFVYPSVAEGFGLPAAEALACGVPTVVSDASSLPEVVGDAGLRFDPTDGQDLALCLRRVVVDRELAADLAARGPSRAERFRWERAAAEMEDVFREALT